MTVTADAAIFAAISPALSEVLIKMSLKQMFLRPNVLRPILFRRRFNLEWNDSFQMTDQHMFNLGYYLSPNALAEAYRAKYPGLSDTDIIGKIKDHLTANDFEWGRTIGVLARPQSPPFRSPVTGEPVRRTTEDYSIEVCAQETVSGTARFYATRSYCACVTIPEEVIEEAIRSDNDPDIIYDWIMEENLCDYDSYPETDSYEYDDEEVTDSENYEVTTTPRTIKSLAEDIMSRYLDEHPELRDEEEDD
jgi:hypothetical protein